MKVTALIAHGLAGYQEISWQGIQPRLNVLLGENGVGKSTLLQTLNMGRNYLAGKRCEDLIVGNYQQAEVTLVFDLPTEPFTIPFLAVSRSQTARKQLAGLRVLSLVENRQPKNAMGRSRYDIREHAMERYPNLLGEIRHLHAADGADRELVEKIFERLAQLDSAGSSKEWQFILHEVLTRGPRKMRPLSCGQYDLLALLLDLRKLRREKGAEQSSAFLIFDNPETFLHPRCQRQVLDLLDEEFPEAQLFFASHSLKLLVHCPARGVFWLSRTPGTDIAHVVAVRDAPAGARDVFFDLYGEDVSSGLLSILRGLESPEYYAYLCQCALPSAIEARADPAADRQMGILTDLVGARGSPWVVLDFGAGHGDMLTAILARENSDYPITYLGVTATPSKFLRQRVELALATGQVTSESVAIEDLGAVDQSCDRVVLCNTCHEILPHDLAPLLAQLLHRLRPSPDSAMVIHEVETISVGERAFLMWVPEDYAALMNGVSGCAVSELRDESSGRVPLFTTLIRRTPEPLPDIPTLTGHLLEKFLNQLVLKRERDLDELSGFMAGEAPEMNTLTGALRQRRMAFLTAQIATADLLLRPIRR